MFSGGVDVFLDQPNGLVPEESCERHQIYASLRDAGRECVAQVVRNPVDCDTVFGGLLSDAVVRGIDPSDVIAALFL